MADIADINFNLRHSAARAERIATAAAHERVDVVGVNAVFHMRILLSVSKRGVRRVVKGVNGKQYSLRAHRATWAWGYRRMGPFLGPF